MISRPPSPWPPSCQIHLNPKLSIKIIKKTSLKCQCAAIKLINGTHVSHQGRQMIEGPDVCGGRKTGAFMSQEKRTVITNWKALMAFFDCLRRMIMVRWLRSRRWQVPGLNYKCLSGVWGCVEEIDLELEAGSGVGDTDSDLLFWLWHAPLAISVLQKHGGDQTSNITLTHSICCRESCFP